MTAEIMYGKELAGVIKNRLKLDVERLISEGKRPPGLATILVGNNPASKLYVRKKQEACEEVGFYGVEKILPANTTQTELHEIIEELNRDERVDGILIQLPLPTHLNTKAAMEVITPAKDVDGFHPLNMGKLMGGEEKIVACTPRGIITLLEHYGITFEGKNVVIINHSTVIGKPLAMLFLNRNATVTICHIHTRNLSFHTSTADILITATGVPKLISAEMIKDGVVVVDAGIARVENKIVGDVDFEEVKKKASFITPVPGGVGPMTIATLLENTFKLYKLRNEEKISFQ